MQNIKLKFPPHIIRTKSDIKSNQINLNLTDDSGRDMLNCLITFKR